MDWYLVLHSTCDILDEWSVGEVAYDNPVSEWNSVWSFIDDVIFWVNGLLMQPLMMMEYMNGMGSGFSFTLRHSRSMVCW
jgi:hypothetical protein